MSARSVNAHEDPREFLMIQHAERVFHQVVTGSALDNMYHSCRSFLFKGRAVRWAGSCTSRFHRLSVCQTARAVVNPPQMAETTAQLFLYEGVATR